MTKNKFLAKLFFEIFDAGDIIRFEPVQLSNPGAELDWDRSWVKTIVTVKGGVFKGQYIAEFTTIDFELFRQQLKKLDSDFNASATFEPLEQQLVLQIKGDGLGHFEVYCEATPESHLGQQLTFSLGFDQTEIKSLVGQLDTITRKFPIDGDFEVENE